MKWSEQIRDGVRIIRPSDAPAGVVVAFSGRGHGPEGERFPTALLSRGLAQRLGLDGNPIHWARQVHGASAATIRDAFAPGREHEAGEHDALATDRAGAALVVQTADCVPILLSGPRAVGAAHAGWRGSAKNVAAAAVAALRGLGEDPSRLRAWLGPSIGPCCYEVGGEVAAQFAGEFARAGCGGRFRLDVRGVNVSQLRAAGIPAERIHVHPDCTLCGGDKYASYRRDGARSGRMIALVARQPSS